VGRIFSIVGATMRRVWRRLRSVPPGSASAKVLTYNILADGQRLALSPKHDYCPLELRQWRGDDGRCVRLAKEVAQYEADIVCLQECSLAAFDQLHAAINTAAGGPVYRGVHSSQCIHEGNAGELLRLQEAGRASETGLAIYVRTDSDWEPAATRSVRLGGRLDQRYTGDLRKKLKTQVHLQPAAEPRHATPDFQFLPPLHPGAGTPRCVHCRAGWPQHFCSRTFEYTYLNTRNTQHPHTRY